jgi:peptidoglycan-associated lipoprotein
MSGTKVAIAAVLALAACHHDKKVTTTPVAQNTPPVHEQTPPKQDTQVSTNINADDDLVKKCQLRFDNQEQAPKFDYDNSQLTSIDRDVLSQVATCLTSGPLKGRAIALVGRADPRGTSEYNLGLGDRRARTVSDYLKRLGMPTNKIKETTRGAIDATGRDEDGWRVDRRVDLELN